MGSLTLDVDVYRVELEALERVSFGRHAGNTWRGALGGQLDEAIFRPRSANGPSGLRDRPRPFVLRASELDGRVLGAGERAGLAVHVFSADCGEALVCALKRAAAEGIGPGRGRLVLCGADCSRVPVAVGAEREAVPEAQVEFVTATELNGGGPAFGVFFRRVRDRLSALATAWGGGAPELDYAGLGERADHIELVSAELQRTESSRRSSRTGQSHPLSGFTGTVRYRGALGEFMPWLRAAEWTGVGRHTVWGNGQLRVL